MCNGICLYQMNRSEIETTFDIRVFSDLRCYAQTKSVQQKLRVYLVRDLREFL